MWILGQDLEFVFGREPSRVPRGPTCILILWRQTTDIIGYKQKQQSVGFIDAGITFNYISIVRHTHSRGGDCWNQLGNYM